MTQPTPDELVAQVVTEAGAYPTMPADTYHADPVPGGSISASGARLLLPPHCPAVYHYRRTHPETRHVWEIGHAAHHLVLGTGPELVVTEEEEWRTNKVKDAVKAVRARGGVPLKPSEWETVTGMAEALRQHPKAGPLLNLRGALVEPSIFWRDARFGVWRRARPDLIRISAAGTLVTDYKTTRSAHPEQLSRSMDDYGYEIQGAWYIDAVDNTPALPAAPVRFLLIAQEKTPPYLVTVAEPDRTAIDIGRRRADQALHLFAQCQASDRWPGYDDADEISYLSLPAWVERRYEESTR